jgi:hypothetical protein
VTTCKVHPAGRYYTLLKGVGSPEAAGQLSLIRATVARLYRKLHAKRVARTGFLSNDAALIVIDPQNDVLSESGVSWELVGASVNENNAIENLARLYSAGKQQQFAVFISPHFL